jgi:hypothetical protein
MGDGQLHHQFLSRDGPRLPPATTMVVLQYPALTADKAMMKMTPLSQG